MPEFFAKSNCPEFGDRSIVAIVHRTRDTAFLTPAVVEVA